MEFQASEISVQREEGLLVVSLADAKMNPKKYVLLQRSSDELEEGEDPDLIGPHLEVNDPFTGGYHFVQAAVLSRGSLSLTLHAQQAKKYRIDATIVATFEISQTTYEQLQAGLQDVFKDLLTIT